MKIFNKNAFIIIFVLIASFASGLAVAAEPGKAYGPFPRNIEGYVISTQEKAADKYLVKVSYAPDPLFYTTDEMDKRKELQAKTLLSNFIIGADRYPAICDDPHPYKTAPNRFLCLASLPKAVVDSCNSCNETDCSSKCSFYITQNVRMMQNGKEVRGPYQSMSLSLSAKKEEAPATEPAAETPAAETQTPETEPTSGMEPKYGTTQTTDTSASGQSGSKTKETGVSPYGGGACALDPTNGVGITTSLLIGASFLIGYKRRSVISRQSSVISARGYEFEIAAAFGLAMTAFASKMRTARD